MFCTFHALRSAGLYGTAHGTLVFGGHLPHGTQRHGKSDSSCQSTPGISGTPHSVHLEHSSQGTGEKNPITATVLGENIENIPVNDKAHSGHSVT